MNLKRNIKMILKLEIDGNKEFKYWYRNEETKKLIEYYRKVDGRNPDHQLMYVIKGGNDKKQDNA